MKKSINYLRGLISKNKPLILAFIVSLFLHFIALSNKAVHSPIQLNAQQTIDVQLTKPENTTARPQIRDIKSLKTINTKEQVVTQSSKNLLPLKTQKLISTTKTQKSASQQHALITESPEEPAKSSTKPLTSEPVAELQTVDSDSNQSKAPSLQATANTVAPTTIITQQGGYTINDVNYKLIETDFEVFQSAHPDTLSVNRVLFTTQGKKGVNQTYILTQSLNDSISKGQAEYVPTTSEGVIASSGLKPNHYASNGNLADFAWSDGVIEIDKKFEKLKKGTQDEVSYLYQFMFTPPLANTEVTFTNGKEIITYNFINLGEQLLNTKIGEIKTVHLSKEGEEKIDIWLAIDYNFIPVKVRKTAVDGTFIEQTAIKLSTALNDSK